MQPSQTDDVPQLPQLEPGLTLLDSTERATGPLQSLVLDHVLLADGEARWVDARGHAATTTLARIAPSRRTLDRIQVARAFTAFQHYSIVETLAAEITAETALVVAPAVDWFYTSDDLKSGEGAEMLEGTLETLSAVARRHDVPVLLTRQSGDGLGSHIADACGTTLEYVRTDFGPRFLGEEFETLVYERPGGVQTTLAFWRRVLERRHAVAQSSPTEVVSRGAH